MLSVTLQALTIFLRFGFARVAVPQEVHDRYKFAQTTRFAEPICEIQQLFVAGNTRALEALAFISDLQ